MNVKESKLLSVVLLVVVSLAPALVPPANADVVRKVDADDSPGFLDIHRLTARHGKGERLQHSITTFERWTSRRLGECSWLDLQMPDAKRVITIFWREGELRAQINNPWGGSAPASGNPRVWRRDARTVVVSFHRDQLGDVGESYKWRVVTFTPKDECPEGDGSWQSWVDAAKNQHSYTHRL